MEFDAAPAPAVAEPNPAPWGFWATIGFSLVIAVIGLVAQFIVTFIGIALMTAVGGGVPDLEKVGENGAILAFATCASAPLVVGLAILFAWLRKGIALTDYLQLRWPTGKTLARWLAGLLVFVAASDTLTLLLDRPVVPPFMVKVYNSTGMAMPVLWLALIVAAPFAEEFLFRGFLFTGLQNSRLKTAGAAIVTSILWAVIHVQYDWYGIATLFIGGLFLAAARVKTGSLWTCVVLHAAMNVIATTQTVLLVKGVLPALGG